MIKYFVLFPNHLNGIKLNQILRKEGIKSTIAPTPRELSVCCGISLLIRKEDVKSVDQIVFREQIDILRIASVEDKSDPKRDRFG